MTVSPLVPAVLIFGSMLALSLIGFVKSFATAVRMDAANRQIPPRSVADEERVTFKAAPK